MTDCKVTRHGEEVRVEYDRLVEIYPIGVYMARQIVNDHMSRNGRYKSRVNNSLYFEVFYNGDGFGYVDPNSELADSIGYDWSHIRDSSDSAFVDMAGIILWSRYKIDFSEFMAELPEDAIEYELNQHDRPMRIDYIQEEGGETVRTNELTAATEVRVVMINNRVRIDAAGNLKIEDTK